MIWSVVEWHVVTGQLLFKEAIDVYHPVFCTKTDRTAKPSDQTSFLSGSQRPQTGRKGPNTKEGYFRTYVSALLLRLVCGVLPLHTHQSPASGFYEQLEFTVGSATRGKIWSACFGEGRKKRNLILKAWTHCTLWPYLCATSCFDSDWQFKMIHKKIVILISISFWSQKTQISLKFLDAWKYKYLIVLVV